MDIIHQAKLKSGHLLHKIALFNLKGTVLYLLCSAQKEILKIKQKLFNL